MGRKFQCNRCQRQQDSRLGFSLSRCYGMVPHTPVLMRPATATTYEESFKAVGRTASMNRRPPEAMEEPQSILTPSPPPKREAHAAPHQAAASHNPVRASDFQQSRLSKVPSFHVPTHIEEGDDEDDEAVAAGDYDQMDMTGLYATLGSTLDLTSKKSCVMSYAEFPTPEEEDEANDTGNPSRSVQDKVRLIDELKEQTWKLQRDGRFSDDSIIWMLEELTRAQAYC